MLKFSNFNCLLLAVGLLLPNSAYGEPIKILEGNITHLEHIEPLKPQLQIGKPFIDSKGSAGKWFELPKWLEGKWDIVSNVQLATIDLKRRILKQDIVRRDIQEYPTMGYQKDKQGFAWTLSKSPEAIVISRGEYRDVIVPEVTEVTNPTDKFALKEKAILIRYDFRSKNITTIERSETVKEFKIIEDGLVSCLTDRQTFDEDGHPKENFKGVQVWKRIDDMQRIDMIGEANLRESFLRFLSDNGFMEKYPDNQEKKDD